MLGVAAATVGVESPVSTIPLRPWHILVIIAVLIALHSRVSSGSVQKILDSRLLTLDVSFILFVIGTSFIEVSNSTILGFKPNLNSQIEPIFWFLTYFAARTIVEDVTSAISVLKGLVFPILVVAPISVAQLIGYSPVLEFTVSNVTADGLEGKLERGRSIRAVGLVGGWTSFGAYSSGVFAVAMALMIAEKRELTKPSQYPIWIIIASVVSVITTLTFGPIIAFLIVWLALVRYLGMKPSKLISLISAGIIFTTFFWVYVSDRFNEQFTVQARYQSWLPEWVPNTIAYRVEVWRNQTIPAILERPLTGWGRGVYDAALGGGISSEATRVTPTTLIWTSPESQWFAIMMTSGIFGLMLLFFLLVCAWNIFFKGLKQQQSSWLSLPSFWLFISNIGIAFTAVSLTNKGFTGVFWPLVGVSVALVLQSEKASEHTRISTENMSEKDTREFPIHR